MKKLSYFLTIVMPSIIFVFIAVNVVNHNANSFDSYIYKVVSKFISATVTNIMIIISFLGSGGFLTALAFIFIVAFYKKERYSFYAAMIAINLLLGAIINLSIKYIIHRNRPNILRFIDIGGFSFPSGHSMVSMSFYGFIIYLCYRNYKTRWKYLIVSMLAILILFIGLSRIYLGVHYASDVIGGFFLGVLWIGVFSIIVDMRYRKKHTDAK